MKGASGVACAEIERVKQEEATRIALKGEHKAEMRRLNKLLE